MEEWGSESRSKTCFKIPKSTGRSIGITLLYNKIDVFATTGNKNFAVK